jgi:DNA-binding HxlR family transcriptional regulator
MSVRCGAQPRRTHELKRQLRRGVVEDAHADLRELETSRHHRRKDYGEIPPRVDYSLTVLGRSLAALVGDIERWVSTNYTRMSGSARIYGADAA